MEEGPPLAVGRYQVVEEIGDGAMGRVWRGHDPLIRRPVAIKTVKSEYLTRETRDEYLQRFRREARAAGLLSHPHIVSLYDVGDDFFVMELLDGRTLAELLRQRGRLPLAEALAVLEPVADAIDYAHRAGVIHRDIKPGNIMVQWDGHPKLMDFGVARVETSAVTEPGHFFGSPSYMAPEQITSSQVTVFSDLYSFAVVAYETLTGRRPFLGDTITSIIYAVVNTEAPAPSSLAPELPERLDAVFRRALAKAPRNRFPSALAFIAALKGESFELTPGVDELAAAAAAAGLDGGTRSDGPVVFGAVETLDIAQSPRAARRRRRRSSLALAWAGVLVLPAAGLFGVVRVAPPAAPQAAAAPALDVETEPSGAEVWLDGVPTGRAPVVLDGLAPGPHRLRVLRDGYAPAEVTLYVTDGMGRVPLRFALAGVTAPVEVRTQAGVKVYVDGNAVGRAPLPPVHVSPGVHELRLEREGYVTQRHALLARPGEPLMVEAQLAPAPAGVAMAEPPPPTPPPAEAAITLPPPATVVPPRPLVTAPAPYPDAARRLRLSGSVLVEVTVEDDGSVGPVRILESAGTLLDQAVVAAAGKWRFEPARQGGRPTRGVWVYRQTFRPR